MGPLDAHIVALDISQEVLQQSIGQEPDKRKKRVQSKFGIVDIPKNHVLCSTPLCLIVTPYWQEQCSYMGQQNVFEDAEQTIKKLTSQQVNAKQIEHLVHGYGMV